MVKAQATAELEQLDAPNKTKYQQALACNATQLAACKSAAEIEALNANAWKAIGDAINSIELTGDDKLDLTYLLTNPNVDDFYTGNHGVKVDAGTLSKWGATSR
jgi:hypothetical protein